MPAARASSAARGAETVAGTVARAWRPVRCLPHEARQDVAVAEELDRAAAWRLQFLVGVNTELA